MIDLLTVPRAYSGSIPRNPERSAVSLNSIPTTVACAGSKTPRGVKVFGPRNARAPKTWSQAARPLSRGQIYHILRNPLYCGRIRHKDKVWPGQHDALIDDALWERVQTLLQTRSGRSRTRGGHSDTNETTSPSPAWLTGKLRDETGDRLTPTHTTKAGRRLRYYVSNRLVSGRGPDRLAPAGRRARGARPGPADRAPGTGTQEHRLLARPDSAMADEIGRAIASLQQGLEGTRGQVAAALDDHGYLTRSEIRITLDLTALSARLALPPMISIRRWVLCPRRFRSDGAVLRRRSWWARRNRTQIGICRPC
ncbi:MAG: recombinase family protein [Maritimibacter sp.]|uniref:recombinase family protein n=1 Tax=Maritimibacter sp. TaxID=2003363 RepID=UPI001DFA89F2|nr:recombinase family protein [Maritimibacter sp.]MBL6426789.1 recombinase family protein [Maritimibacter sp.]